MIQIKEQCNAQSQELFNSVFPNNNFYPREESLFFDIETTGFSPKNTMCYLIGAIYYKDGLWQYIQWFAENIDDEPLILKAFFDYMKDYSVLIHFNGDGFDLPFLTGRCHFYKLPYSFDQIDSFDLFKKARGFKNLLGLDNYKQKTIEQFLGIQREDQYSGGDLINVYKEYVAFHESEKKDLLLLHNHDDICGMPALLPLLSYSAIYNGAYRIVDAELNTAKSFEGQTLQEVIITAKTDASLPAPVSLNSGPYTIRIQENMMKLRIPVYEGLLKHFYPNYKDYFYLPDEDEAMHKSVAAFVDKSRRVKATAANCYTKKCGSFLPQAGEEITPVFKIDLKNKLNFFQFTNEFITEKEQLYPYVKEIMDQLLR